MSTQPKTPIDTEARTRFDQVKKQGMPNDVHKKLSVLVGEWDITTTTYSGPNAQPIVSRGGHSSVKPVYGGRYFVWTNDEKYLDEAIQTMGTITYNTRSMKMSLTEHYSYATNVLAAVGPAPVPGDERTGTTEFSLQADQHVDSFTGSRDVSGARIAFKIVGPNKHIRQIFETDELNTKEYLVSESVFTRKAAAK